MQLFKLTAMCYPIFTINKACLFSFSFEPVELTENDSVVLTKKFVPFSTKRKLLKTQHQVDRLTNDGDRMDDLLIRSPLIFSCNFKG